MAFAKLDVDDFSESIAVPLALTVQRDEAPLEKTVSLFSGIALIVSSIIGSGIFASPGPVLAYTQSVGMALLIWLFAGFLALSGSLCYAELGTMIPSNGGEHPYLLKFYGSLPPFLFSWTGVLVTRPAAIAIISSICAEYIARLVFFSNPGQTAPKVLIKIIALMIVTSLTTINCLSTKLNNKVQNVFTVFKVSSLLIIGIVGIAAVGKTKSILTQKELFEGTTTDAGDYALALYSALWAYDGWNNLNMVTGELKEPEKNLPKAVIIGPGIVIVCYLLANLAYYASLPFESIVVSNTLALDFGKVAFGSIGGTVIPLIVIGSTLGAANASIFTGARVTHVSSQHGHAPRFLSQVNSATNTPVNALVLQGVIALVFVLSASFTGLVTFYCIIAWSFYFLSVFGLVKSRFHDPLLHRPFKVWTSVAVVFCLSCVFLVVSSVIEKPIIALWSFLFLFSGIPMWYIVVYKDIPWEDLFSYLKFMVTGGLDRSRSASSFDRGRARWTYMHDEWDEFEDDKSMLTSGSFEEKTSAI